MVWESQCHYEIVWLVTLKEENRTFFVNYNTSFQGPLACRKVMMYLLCPFLRVGVGSGVKAEGDCWFL